MNDWVIPRVPNGYVFRVSKLPDHRNTDFVTSSWMDEADRFLLSIIQGPAAMAASKYWICTLGTISTTSDIVCMHGLRGMQSNSRDR